jgi:hypothetical protein
MSCGDIKEGKRQRLVYFPTDTAAASHQQQPYFSVIQVAEHSSTLVPGPEALCFGNTVFSSQIAFYQARHKLRLSSARIVTGLCGPTLEAS